MTDQKRETIGERGLAALHVWADESRKRRNGSP